mmetsp:Transcript_131473/g.239073  ORF Transcript_131473/g.239073 Transcript_131473/m.239073 type:complete len:129 (-) Transcript_131473:408-794(-)
MLAWVGCTPSHTVGLVGHGVHQMDTALRSKITPALQTGCLVAWSAHSAKWGKPVDVIAMRLHVLKQVPLACAKDGPVASITLGTRRVHVLHALNALMGNSVQPVISGMPLPHQMIPCFGFIIRMSTAS